MTEIKNNSFQNSSLELPNLELLENNSTILKTSSPINPLIKFCQSPILLNASSSNNYNNFFQKKEENEYDYSYFNNVQTYNNLYESINYLNQENICQTPVMNFNIINKTNDTQNQLIENFENKEFQKLEKNTNDTCDSSKNIKINTSTIIPKIENIVSTANLCVKINLRQVALQSKNAEYNPKRFSAVIMKIKDPKTTGLIFSSGRIVCLGAKIEEESRKACRKFAKIIKSMGYPVVFKEFTIQNIVGSVDIKCQLSLIKLYIHLMKKTSYKKISCVAYEPEQFPGLIYRMIEPKIVLLIFSSGKMVLTGGKERDDIYNGFEKIYPLLIKFKIENQLKNNKILHNEIVEKMKEIKENEIKENDLKES